MTDRSAILTRYYTRINQQERTKLTASEQTALTDAFLEDVRALNDAEAIQQRCREEIALLEAGYPVQTVASRMLAPYRKLVRQAIDDGQLPLTDSNSHVIRFMKQSSGEVGTLTEHWALTALKYDPTTYQALRGQAVTQNNVRQDHLQPITLDTYLAAVDALLDRTDPPALTAGIAAATGRRHTEIVSKGTFTATDHPYQLVFSGQQKKRDSTPPYTIVTLRPADRILRALKALRSHPRVQALSALPASDGTVRSFNSQVNYTVQQTFGKTGIVPQIAGARSVSVHRLRGVYVAIALYFWCPPEQNEHRFIQAHLGHVLDATSPNSSATTHYFHYRLVDMDGRPLLGKGMMLPKAPSLPESTTQTPLPTGNTRPIIRSADLQRLYQLTDLLQLEGNTADRMHGLLTWATSQINVAINSERGTRPSSNTSETADAIAAARAPLQQLIDEQGAAIEQLTTSLAQAQQERDQFLAQTTQSQEEQARMALQIASLQDEQQRLVEQSAAIEPLNQALDQSRTERAAVERELALLQQQYAVAQTQLTAFHQLRAALLGPEPTPPSPIVATPDRPPTPLAPATTTATMPVSPADTQRVTASVAAATAPRSLRGDARVQRIWALIQHWNTAPGRDDHEKVQVNAAMLESKFGVFRQNAKRFVETHQDAIDEHHREHDVDTGRTHNRSVPDYVWEDIRAALDDL